MLFIKYELYLRFPSHGEMEKMRVVYDTILYIIIAALTWWNKVFIKCSLINTLYNIFFCNSNLLLCSSWDTIKQTNSSDL